MLNQMFGVLSNNKLAGLGFDGTDKRLQYVDCRVCLATIQRTVGSIEHKKQACRYTQIVDISCLGSMKHTVM